MAGSYSIGIGQHSFRRALLKFYYAPEDLVQREIQMQCVWRGLKILHFQQTLPGDADVVPHTTVQDWYSDL